MAISRFLKFVMQVLHSPGRVVAPGLLLTDRWTTSPGAQSWAFRTIDRFHEEPRSKIEEKCNSLESMLSKLPLDGKETRGNALVFLHRGDAILHSCHQLIIAAGLESMGYRVEFVVCGGGVERCGVGQVRSPFSIPPLTCFTCKNCLTPLRKFTIPTLHLAPQLINQNTFDANVELQTPLPEKIDELLYPALLRHFQGHLPELSCDRSEHSAHYLASRRFISRCRKAFTDRQPKVVSLFNGQTFPESVIGHLAGEMGIPTLFSERGVLPNSLFVSRDSPASHYQVDRLWEATRDFISESDREAVREYVGNRRQNNIDPLGVDRGFNRIGGDAAHDAITKEPYAVFFAPVLHDTASAGKDNGLGEVPQVLLEICRVTRERGLRLIVRSHPDERRPHNPARYTIRQLLIDQGVQLGDYQTVNLDSDTSWNPYILAERAKQVIVHNGTIAMECGVMGIRPINTGRSHYGGKGFTLDPRTLGELRAMLEHPVPRLDAKGVALAESYVHYYLHIATLNVSGLFREGPDFTCEVLAPSEEGEKQMQTVQKRVDFLLHK